MLDELVEGDFFFKTLTHRLILFSLMAILSVSSVYVRGVLFDWQTTKMHAA